MPSFMLKRVLPFILTLGVGVALGSLFSPKPVFRAKVVLDQNDSYRQRSWTSNHHHSGNISPVIITRKPQASYTELARKSQITGSVKLRMLLRKDGTVAEITPVRTLPGGLTEEAVRAASRIEFIPAMINGEPVDMVQWVEYNFDVSERGQSDPLLTYAN
ncbi:MAG TPA: energy transducer TonB [Pyrinomonadaceae bacterium]|jgi:hypothetical protein